eukprot:TRINITY_DN10683_c0_g1_i1.p1 TRINITY_DN10683_c0_g1~~TRINITY_DN10683_c0_g1_i1.p1  ORF type:complete len:270 (+),score=62.89 TRINITY_DN10683_c0_g1_i1:179-988(+)
MHSLKVLSTFRVERKLDVQKRYFSSDQVTKSKTVFVDDSTTVKDLEQYIDFPVRVIGTRKPNKLLFWAWDLNLSLFRDILNPNLYLTFRDSTGKIIGPIKYTSQIKSYGIKPEAGIRFQFGRLSKEIMHYEFEKIPTDLDVAKGFDATLPGAPVTFSFSNFRLDDLKYARLNYFGVTFASFGYTHVTSGKFERNEKIDDRGFKPPFEYLFLFFLTILVALAFFFVFITPLQVRDAIKEAQGDIAAAQKAKMEEYEQKKTYLEEIKSSKD